MDIADRMNIQPWKLIGGSRLLWFIRYEAVRQYEAEAARRARNKPQGVDQINTRQRNRR